MTDYTGIDVLLRMVSICVVDDKGEVCLEAKAAALLTPSWASAPLRSAT